MTLCRSPAGVEMILRELLKDCSLAETIGDDNILNNMEISGVAYDSRSVKAGYLFVAVRGEKYDGHNFVTDAIRKGAVAVVTEREEIAIKGEETGETETSPSARFVPDPGLYISPWKTAEGRLHVS